MATSTIERLRAAASGYQHASILAALAELDLGTAILEHNNRIGAALLAEQKLCSLRGVTVLLDALVGRGYLEKCGNGDDACYSVADDYKEYLDSRHPLSFIPMMRHMANDMRGWSRLTWLIRDGTVPERVPSILGAEQDRMSFIMAMDAIAVAAVGPTVRDLMKAGVLSAGASTGLSGFRFLDIGGASGTYTLAFLEAMDGSKGTVFDLPVGIKAARKRFLGSQFEDRVTLVEGDFYQDDLPTGFDFAWISAIIHQHGRSETRALFRKAFDALNPGGTIAVRDYMMNDQRTLPPDGSLFGVNMLMASPTGMVYKFAEVDEDLRSVGFVDVRLAVPSQTMSSVVVGVKPG